MSCWVSNNDTGIYVRGRIALLPKHWADDNRHHLQRWKSPISHDSMGPMDIIPGNLRNSYIADDVKPKPAKPHKVMIVSSASRAASGRIYTRDDDP